MDLLSKRDLHGQNPIVTPCNKQSLSQFEMQSRKSETPFHRKINTSADWTEFSELAAVFALQLFYDQFLPKAHSPDRCPEKVKLDLQA